MPKLETHSADPEAYEIIKAIGAGNMGEVYFARDQDLMRDIAYKRLRPSVSTEETRRRFLREARITAQLDHPNIVPVYALRFEASGALGYAMKFVEGRTLEALLSAVRHRLKHGQPIDPGEDRTSRLRMFLYVCHAVAAAHEKGVLHRDIKPANVLVGSHGQVFLTDWGLARLIDQRSPLADMSSVNVGGLSEEPTQAGSILGTIMYMSPEQANGRTEGLDPGSDIFALGLMLYEVLTLEHPYAGGDMKRIMDRVRGGKVRLHRSTQEGRLDPDLIAIVHRATQVRPEERYPSAADLASDVRAYLAGESLTAVPDSLRARARRWIRRRPDLGLLTVGGLMVIDLVLLIWLLIS